MSGEEEFVKRRIYLTLERGRDIALRNLLRTVFLAGGYEDVKEGEEGKPRVRKTRVPVDMFGAAISLSQGSRMDADEVECLLANMIYKVSRVGCLGRNFVSALLRVVIVRLPQNSSTRSHLGSEAIFIAPRRRVHLYLQAVTTYRAVSFQHMSSNTPSHLLPDSHFHTLTHTHTHLFPL